MAAAETFIPTGIVLQYKQRPVGDPPTLSETLLHSARFEAALYTGLVAGSALTFYYLLSAISIRRAHAKTSLKSSDERGTSMLKRACSRKLGNMIQLAREMHRDVFQVDDNQIKDLRSSQKVDLKLKTPSDEVFQAYVLHGEGRERCASWSWVLKKLLSKELFQEEGIWLPSRIWIFQAIQIVVLSLYIILINIFIENAIKRVSDARAELPEGLPSWVYGKFYHGHAWKVFIRYSE